MKSHNAGAGRGARNHLSQRVAPKGPARGSPSLSLAFALMLVTRAQGHPWEPRLALPNTLVSMDGRRGKIETDHLMNLLSLTIYSLTINLPAT